jgi:hypothetical protein
VVNSRRWHDLSPRVRRLILVGGTVEGILKVIALIDLARRPSSQVRGSKLRWALSITLINSGGAVPILYFTRGKASVAGHPRNAERTIADTKLDAKRVGEGM